MGIPLNPYFSTVRLSLLIKGFYLCYNAPVLGMDARYILKCIPAIGMMLTGELLSQEDKYDFYRFTDCILNILIEKEVYQYWTSSITLPGLGSAGAAFNAGWTISQFSYPQSRINITRVIAFPGRAYLGLVDVVLNHYVWRPDTIKPWPQWGICKKC